MEFIPQDKVDALLTEWKEELHKAEARISGFTVSADIGMRRHAETVEQVSEVVRMMLSPEKTTKEITVTRV